MIVQPTPTNPRSPVGRALRLTGLVLPVVLLAAVMAAGLAGPKVEPLPAERAPSPGASVETAAQEPEAAPSRTPNGPVSPFPDVAADLAVRTIIEARPELVAATGRPLVIEGWLTGIGTDPGCTTAAGDSRNWLSPLCERSARLVVEAAGVSNASAHLHVRVPPGVRLPPPFEWPGALDAEPVPVVLVGRAAGPGHDCVGSARGCGQAFTLDRVAWASGEPFEPGTIFDAGLEVPLASMAYRRRDVAESLAAGASGTVLVSAVVRPRTMSAIDPEAAAALALAPEPEGLVWYVRALQTSYSPGRFPPNDDPARLVWVLVDEMTGQPLAGGISGEPATTAMAPAGPGSIASLPVREVDAVLAAFQGTRGRHVVVVTGFLRAWVDPQACTAPIPGLTGLGCERQAILATGPWTTSGSGGPDLPGAHLRAIIPAGVAIPEAAVDIRRGRASATRVTLVGRFGATAAECADDLSGCPAPLVIERVTWAGGSRFALGRQVALPLAVPAGDAVATDADRVAASTMGLGTELLRVVLVEPRDLAALDASAATAVARAGGWHGPVWYLRGIDVPPQPSGGPPYNGEAADIHWAVVDQATGNVIATSPARG